MLIYFSRSLEQLPSLLLKHLPSDFGASPDKPQKLVSISISLLRSLCQLLAANHLNLQEALSIAEQRNLKTALEVVVVWGMVPYFLKGVGVPIQKRSKLVTADLLPARYALGQDRRLLPCVELLFELIMHGSDFSVVVANNYLSDMFAALLQLTHAPPPADAPGMPSNVVSFLISEDTRKQLLDWVRLVHDRVPVQASYPALVVLLGGAPPEWLKKSAGLLLSSKSRRFSVRYLSILNSCAFFFFF